MEELKTSDIRDSAKKELKKLVKGKALINKIEASILNFSIDFCTTNEIDEELCEYTYQEKLEQILEAFRSSKDDLTLALKTKSLKPENIAFLTPQELDPSKWKKILDKKEKNRQSRKDANVTMQYTCKKCKHKKHTVISLQTRSADEPMTEFITCTNCGHTFKK